MLGDDGPLQHELQKNGREHEGGEVVDVDLVRIFVEQAEYDQVYQGAGVITSKRPLPVGRSNGRSWHQRFAGHVHRPPRVRASQGRRIAGPVLSDG